MSRPLTNFRIAVPDADLRDLRERLTRTRWPEPETVGDWSQGVPRACLQELCEYWAERYDWRATEARLNALPQFRTELDGLGIHFVHVRSPHPGALPLVVTHGWPGSVAEYLKVIGPLTDPTAHGGDPADAFHVVCPSLPGYGFSDKAAQPGWGVERRSRRPTPRRSTISPTRSARRSARWSRRASGIPATPSSTPPGPRRSATGSWTRRPACARGSRRSSGRGPTGRRTSRRRSRATSCSTP
jgi:epoxide hydrolase